MTKYPMNKEY